MINFSSKHRLADFLNVYCGICLAIQKYMYIFINYSKEYVNKSGIQDQKNVGMVVTMCLI